MMDRIGIFGGSFNPVHVGHLLLAEHARQEADLNSVLFIPACQPPHKRTDRLLPVHHRLQMLKLAIAENPSFEISTLELDREGPSYTLITVRELKAHYPDKKPVLILGSDSILDLPNWWHAKELVQEIELLGMNRPGHTLENTEHLADRFGKEITRQLRGCIIEAPLIQISATEIRHRIQQNKSVRYMVPEQVRTYIEQHQLYVET